MHEPVYCRFILFLKPMRETFLSLTLSLSIYNILSLYISLSFLSPPLRLFLRISIYPRLYQSVYISLMNFILYIPLPSFTQFLCLSFTQFVSLLRYLWRPTFVFNPHVSYFSQISIQHRSSFFKSVNNMHHTEEDSVRFQTARLIFFIVSILFAGFHCSHQRQRK